MQDVGNTIGTTLARVLWAGIIGALSFVVPVEAAGNTWYVATTGVNNAGCGASGAPCLTVSYVLANKVTAADTILMAPGTYAQESISFSGAGHQGVTLTAQNPSDRPLIAGTSGASIDIFADDVTVSYIRLRGYTNPSGSGTWDPALMEIGATGVTIDHNEIYNGGNGIRITVLRGVAITNNDIHDGGSEPWPTCGGIDHHGIAIYQFSPQTPAANWAEGILVDNNRIYGWEGDGMQDLGQGDTADNPTKYLTQSNNEIFHNCEQGLDYKGARYVRIIGNDIYENGYGGISTNDSDGAVNYRHLYWWIEGNRIHDHDNFGLMSQEGDDGNWYVWNNAFYRNCQNPFYNWWAFTQPPPNSRVEHNVFWNNNRTAGNAAGGIISERASSVVIRNNIFFNNGLASSGNIYSGSVGTIDRNYVYPTSPGATGTNAVTANSPRFADISAAPYDFHLQSDSPAIGVGAALTGDADYTIGNDGDDVARPQDGSWDLGAYEYVSSTPDTTPPAAPSGLGVQ